MTLIWPKISDLVSGSCAPLPLATEPGGGTTVVTDVVPSSSGADTADPSPESLGAEDARRYTEAL